MTKEISNNTFFRTRKHFDEQVNFILLIMFLSVAVIITMKGCGGTICSNDKPVLHTEENIIQSDSVSKDSVDIPE